MNIKKYVKLTSLLLAMLAFSNTYAINVNVRSTSKQIMGLGFTVNGSKHGGAGTSYEGSDMPKGSYRFGVRSKGKDITCVSSDGKRQFKLTKNTNAVLKFKGGKCIAVVK
jgi:hypothetical protein